MRPGAAMSLDGKRVIVIGGASGIGLAGLPLPRGATPTQAATAYVYLMLNSYVTGQILAVDGGGLLV
jgi:NAD(P)-dependent dehydrogenase (short-subunit alcohol dehydrogenase family)